MSNNIKFRNVPNKAKSLFNFVPTPIKKLYSKNLLHFWVLSIIRNRAASVSSALKSSNNDSTTSEIKAFENDNLTVAQKQNLRISGQLSDLTEAKTQETDHLGYKVVTPDGDLISLHFEQSSVKVVFNSKVVALSSNGTRKWLRFNYGSWVEDVRDAYLDIGRLEELDRRARYEDLVE